MPEFLSLAEAARTLGMSEDELKKLAQERRVRAFMDGGSWQFRKADVEEEARRRGMGSDPELPLSDLDLEMDSPLDTGSEDQIDLTEYQIGLAPPDAAPASRDLPVSSSDDDILLDDRTLLAGDPTGGSSSGSSSKIIGMQRTPGKRPSDSDVRLVPPGGKGASDSDVRLGAPAAADSDIKLVDPNASDVTRKVARPKPTDLEKPKAVSDSSATTRKVVRPSRQDDLTQADDDAVRKGTAGPFDDPNATVLQPSPVLEESSDELPAVSDSDSDFDLTPSSVIDMLEPESGSEFELTALDASDEIDAIRSGKPSDSDVTGAPASSSGVNIGNPSDSGINLAAVGGFDMDFDASIELEPLDEDSSEPAAKDTSKLAGRSTPPGGKGEGTSKLAGRTPPPEKVDLSATALPIASDRDIFEDTDFDVDVEAISGDDDRTVQIEARSDFDSDENSSESASEVLIEEDDVDANAATSMRPSVEVDEEFESDEETPSAWEVDDEPAPAAVAARGVRPAAGAALIPSAAGPAQEWGGLWVGLIMFASLLMLFLTFISLDLVRNLYYFQGDTPASGIITQLANLF